MPRWRAALKCGTIEHPAYELPDANHDFERWWSEFVSMARGALRVRGGAAKDWLMESIELGYEQLGNVSPKYSKFEVGSQDKGMPKQVAQVVEGQGCAECATNRGLGAPRQRD
eukprot:15438761-Alexandrium_andersonii.AAC.1